MLTLTSSAMFATIDFSSSSHAASASSFVLLLLSTLTLLCGEMRVPTQGAQGFAPLLDLFPDDKAVSEVALEGELTRIAGDGFVLLLHPDGTPAACRTPTADVRVVEFAGG